MANERTYPLLPCRDIDEAIAFYKALGFTQTYRQLRPNPYAVVALEDIHIHLFGMDNFRPEDSYGSVIIAVPDPDGLYYAFAEGLRAAYGKLPAAGIPRILRPRKKYGTVRGFSVVDPGGNWLRVSRLNDSEEADSAEKAQGLAQALYVAARLGDAHGDEAAALKTLETALARYPNASPLETAQARLYQAELAARLGDWVLARQALRAARAAPLTEAERSAVADELAHVEELLAQEQPPAV